MRKQKYLLITIKFFSYYIIGWLHFTYYSSDLLFFCLPLLIFFLADYSSSLSSYYLYKFTSIIPLL